MVWHGTSKTQAGKAVLTDDQWLMLAELAEDSEYWSKAYDFVKQTEGCKLCSLTEKQAEWFCAIEASLGRELNLREAKEVWGERSEQAARIFEEVYGGRKYR